MKAVDEMAEAEAGAMVATVGDVLAAAEAAARSVPDPELPVVTLGDLGIVREVVVREAERVVEVALTPTYVGCPATEAIAGDVRGEVAGALGAGWDVRTVTVLKPSWTTDWITEDGRRKLREHGIAPPGGAAAAAAGVVMLGMPGMAGADAVACPRCGSTETRLISAFGSTACQALRACRACGEPFGAVKAL